MKGTESDHTLEYLLDFDGREHHYPDGYFLKFEIKRIDPTHERSFTLHGPEGTRLIGFDNAHAVAPVGRRYKKKQVETDHSASDRERSWSALSVRERREADRRLF